MRDLAKQFHKEVDFVIEGADTELDKKVLEEINDPLIHIMRNAVDHGVESPEVREAAGKPRAGTIRMAARQEGDHIVIEISDDGAGIDPETRAAGRASARATSRRAKRATCRTARPRYLIFESGFSTSADHHGDLGRGVGMDVVRQFVVDKLKGSMDVESELGQGHDVPPAHPADARDHPRAHPARRRPHVRDADRQHRGDAAHQSATTS